MQLLPILLVAALVAVDGGLRPLGAAWGLGHETVALISCGPIAIAVLFCAFGMSWCERRLRRGEIPRPLMMAERMGHFARTVIVATHMLAVLVFGWLDAVRSTVGNLVLVDELMALSPALIGLAGIWWAYFPIERRLRDSHLISILDRGQPVFESLSRTGYVFLQFRMHMLLFLLPVLLIVGTSEAVTKAGLALDVPRSSQWMLAVGKLAAGVGVFTLAPLLARATLGLQPMAQGPRREALLDVCRRHGVRIRELLVWNTNGTMFNAAVMGLLGRLRYVMVTDALLETMNEDQIRAVMAHEIGHVRRHHMVWMILCLMACFLLAGYAIELPLHALEHHEATANASSVDGISMGVMGVETMLGLLLFGWVCRRFERQADTFAVQHLSSDPSPENGQTSTDVTPEAVQTMADSLEAIARLNGIDPNRPSWRHGSIAWRVHFLFSLIGRPRNRLSIDRLVRWLKIAAAIVLALSCGHALVEYVQCGGTIP